MSSDQQAEAVDERSQAGSQRSDTANYVPASMPAQAVTSSDTTPPHSFLNRFETPTSDETAMIDLDDENTAETVASDHGDKESSSNTQTDIQLDQEPHEPLEIQLSGSRVSLSMQKLLSPPLDLVSSINKEYRNTDYEELNRKPKIVVTKK